MATSEPPQAKDGNKTETIYDPLPLQHSLIASWFLGPQSEAYDRLITYFVRAMGAQTKARTSFHPDDGVRAKENVRQLVHTDVPLGIHHAGDDGERVVRIGC